MVLEVALVVLEVALLQLLLLQLLLLQLLLPQLLLLQLRVLLKLPSPLTAGDFSLPPTEAHGRGGYYSNPPRFIGLWSCPGRLRHAHFEATIVLLPIALVRLVFALTLAIWSNSSDIGLQRHR